MISRIARVALQSLARREAGAALATAETQPVQPAERLAAHRHAPTASVVALAPATLSALMEAQEHLAGDVAASARSDTTHKIDRILLRLDETAPGPSAVLADDPALSLQMLMLARRQLHELVA